MRLPFILFTTLVLGACASQVPAPTPEAMPSKELSESKPQLELNKIGKAIAKAKCDSTVPIRREPIPNTHNPKLMDEIQTQICPGFEVSTYIAKYFSPPKEFPMKLSVQAKDKRIPGYASVGARSSDVLQALGKPLRLSNSEIVYQADIEGLAADTITFKIANGVVHHIDWGWFFP